MRTPSAPLQELDAVTPKHAFRAGKSGVVLSFKTKAAADWLPRATVWTAASCAGGIKLRPRQTHYEVLLRNVPLHVGPALPSFKDVLITENIIPDDCFDIAR
ncbi:hypothetical protein AURDEDRAFT_165503 [Auricularia subglabra TFB-10046 SS5]|nr:hypothetical protein AURDEDRAFT_165503 [Auricularia subglabra TFB-10046 SS5]